MLEAPVEEHLYLYPPKDDLDEEDDTLYFEYELYRELTHFLGQYEQ